MSLAPQTAARQARDSLAVRDQRPCVDRQAAERFHASRALLKRLRAGGTSGNARLTTATGIVLLVLLAVIGVTLLRLRSLLWVHLFVGMLLIGPIVLKLASTGYRFVRYYTDSPHYRREGPPLAPLRALAPLVVLTTVVVFVSGVLLLLIGPSSRGALLPIHKISFIAWAIFTSLHVLGHLPEVAAAVGLDRKTVSKVDVLAAMGVFEDGDLSAWQSPNAALAARAGRAGRGLSLAAALASGTVLAVAVIPQFGPWLHASTPLHHN